MPRNVFLPGKAGIRSLKLHDILVDKKQLSMLFLEKNFFFLVLLTIMSCK